LKLLIVSQYFHPERFLINDIARTLAARGHEVDVLTGKPNYPEGRYYQGYGFFGINREQWQGVNIFRLPLAARGRANAIRLIINYLSFVVSGLLLGPWALRGRRHDCVLVFANSPLLKAIPAIFVSWIKRAPLLIWVQDLWPESLTATGHVNNSLVMSLVRKVVRFIYRHADMLLVQSHAFEPSIRQLMPDAVIRYYPNSVDQVFDTPEHQPGPCPAPMADGFRVVFAGNIGSAQAPDVIVEAAAALADTPEIRLVMIGDGSKRAWMEQQAQQRGLTNLVFPGSFPLEQVPGLLAHADVLLATLNKQPIFALTIPSKIQSYMAMARPVVVSIDGEGARIVEEADCGLAVPAGDGAALAQAIRRLHATDAGQRRQLGQNGRQYYETHFGREHLMQELVTLCQQAMNRDREHNQ